MTRNPPGVPEGMAVSRWYAAKTGDILRRYGPGPRVHYHTGWTGEQPDTTGDAPTLEKDLRSAQVRLLDVAAARWNAERNLTGHVLDVGCGLGGGSIYWAERHGARVTALTNVVEHVGLVQGFVDACGLRDRIEVMLSDACAPMPGAAFDAVVAIESSCYFPRPRWFEHLRGLLRPRGFVFVSDIFATSREIEPCFDADWMTRIGSVEEYLEAASAAGFECRSMFDASDDTRGFWQLSLAYLRAMRARAPDRNAAWDKSMRRHERLLRGWEDGQLRCIMLAFRLR